MKQKKNLTLRTILRTIESRAQEISRFEVKKLGLFGSYRSGKQHTKSDIDFLVKFKKPSFDNYMDLKFYLEKLFRKKVDLVMEGSIKPALRRIKEEAVYVKGLEYIA